MMQIDSGTLSERVRWSDETMYWPSNSMPGSDFTVEPLATIRFLALICCAPTSMVPRSRMRPLPATTSTLFFFIRYCTRLNSWFTTASRRAAIRG